MSAREQSKVYTWTEANIRKAPETCGVYTLRTGTPVASIGYVGMVGAGRLRARLMEHWTKRDHPKTTHFHWVKCPSEREAASLERSWREKYEPPWNG